MVRISNTLLQPLQIALENFVGRRQVGHAVIVDGERVEIRPVMCKFGYVRLQKIAMLRVKRLQIAIEKFLRHFLIKGMLGVMIFLQQTCCDIGDAAHQSG